MASKRDLVEAHAFGRRRLVTAFVSGAPGGREIEPARPLRTLAGGAALAMLLVAGAAVAGLLRPAPPVGWREPGVVTVEETGEMYVVTADDQVLHPVVSPASAQVLFGADVRPRRVPLSALQEASVGESVGVVGGPAALPTTERLHLGPWTACTADGVGVRVRLATSGTGSGLAGSVVAVRVGRRLHLVVPMPGAGSDPAALRLAVPTALAQPLLEGLGLGPASSAPEVPPTWLALLPDGGRLRRSDFALPGRGEPLAYADAASGLGGRGLRVGDVVRAGSTSYLLTRDGPAALSRFAGAAYAGWTAARTTTVSRLATAIVDPVWPSWWPTAAVEPSAEPPCLRLLPAAGGAPLVQLAAGVDPSGLAPDVTPGDAAVLVEPGRGAAVLAGGFSDTTDGAPYVVDARGVAYPLSGDAVARLGYPEPAVIPVPWLRLLGCGVELSVEAAGSPPDGTGVRRC